MMNFKNDIALVVSSLGQGYKLRAPRRPKPAFGSGRVLTSCGHLGVRSLPSARELGLYEGHPFKGICHPGQFIAESVLTATVPDWGRVSTLHVSMSASGACSTSPHGVEMNNAEVDMVLVPGKDSDFGILPGSVFIQ
ncbi:hypothetical protein CYMTET_40094 [Cymbomonas tetramitiformis]|uniref:Uncharacterized protein n=1 Tax=Cymbomonas tetramitiformis TaxID=36881 RepID=A0AAE0CB02_9CHLO|nr:hypothetical protein CYMTET_40094 [Cymbomonas tetramitiformis]